MASLSYSEDLTCSVCLAIFTDPVNLPCGHSFCRKCIAAVLNTQQQCPQCRTDVATEAKCLPTSLILKSLAEKAKESERTKKERGDESAQITELCPEHEEKLKLFCVTDQQLACIICRDGVRHEGHKFKPVGEAAASVRKELEMFLQQAAGDISATESLANTQKDEITKTKEKSQQLMTQISSQFEEMYRFLKKREDEIKNELKCKEKEGVGKMAEALNAIEAALSESRELEAKASSVLKITDSERFLKSWTDSSSMTTPEQLLRPRANQLQVVNSSLSLEPYESHLQFFVWKEMLQVIQPRAERLTIKSHSPDVVVSDDGRSLYCKPKTNQAHSMAFGSVASSQASPFGFGSNQRSGFGEEVRSPFGGGARTSLFGTPQNDRMYSGFGSPYTAPTSFVPTINSSAASVRYHASGVSAFTSAQHYWEIEVGNREYWALGIKDHFLEYGDQKYVTYVHNTTTELTFENKPGKIGIYLSRSSNTLSFYDADNMTHIHTMSVTVSMPVSVYIKISHKAPDYSPVTVLWY
ncbi:nuclear factor 7, ovary-like isoform 1-T1 [Odontesthes bonariensis]|uniref:nuclear factor 7, ovary-like n=1 Tax=Odontesthes bonariensis TaxID=219752 RepID=UPI003F58A299